MLFCSFDLFVPNEARKVRQATFFSSNETEIDKTDEMYSDTKKYTFYSVYYIAKILFGFKHSRVLFMTP